MFKHIKAVVSYVYEKVFQRSLFRLSRAEREQILAQFPEPKDLIERSYFQYRCHMQGASRILRLTQTLISYPALLILLIFGMPEPREKGEQVPAVYISYGIGKEIIPASLSEHFNRILQLDDPPICLSARERAWFLPVCRRYWNHPYFLLKSYVKVGMYAAIQRLHDPRAMIVYSEFSFTSSLLTAYCEHIGIEHINVLHGEKLLNTRDAFVSYHRFFVWNEGYCNMFVQMRAEPTQFVVEIPPMLQLQLPEHIPMEYDLTYYAGSLTEEQLLALRSSLEKLRDRGKRICIRMHPRFGDHALLRKYFREYDLEDALQIPLEQSLAKTRACCGIASTVLYQAFLCGKCIVIDDVTDPQRFRIMKELDYQMLSHPHQLLSEQSKERQTQNA